MRGDETGEMVAEGADIPLEQILAGPRRSMLQFETVDNGRSIGQMIRGEKSLPPSVIATGWKKPDKTGFARLTRGQYVAHRTGPSNCLAVAYIIQNDTQGQRLQAQTCSTRFSGTNLRHYRQYLKPVGEGGTVTENIAGQCAQDKPFVSSAHDEDLPPYAYYAC